ncbi:hypothetical protein ABT297_19165 [Dactylosporangium sp. NPDC000555]|uniref:hypothetical protein n=1 Tax=Dactylosporangium sp. NPDC000555 TaxID=3154260 RepID=UPI0033249D4F
MTDPVTGTRATYDAIAAEFERLCGPGRRNAVSWLFPDGPAHSSGWLDGSAQSGPEAHFAPVAMQESLYETPADDDGSIGGGEASGSRCAEDGCARGGCAAL